MRITAVAAAQSFTSSMIALVVVICMFTNALTLTGVHAQATISITSFTSYGGSIGSSNGQFEDVVSVSVDSSGHLWVADEGNDRIVEFNPVDFSGTFMTYGSQGSGTGEFLSPSHVCVDASGYVWVADQSNNRIVQFHPADFSGSFTTYGSQGTGSGQFWTPSGVFVDSSNNVWVADSSNGRIVRFNPLDFSGSFTFYGAEGSGSGQFMAPRDVSVDSSGNVWVADFANYRIVQFNPSAFSESFAAYGSQGSGNAQFSHPWAVSVDLSGHIWVGDWGNNRIVQFNPADFGGSFATYGSEGSGSGQFSSPTGVQVDSSNQVWVADSFNHRIVQLQSSSSVVGDPVFRGFAGQTFQVHGESSGIYNLLTFPLMNLNALFSAIGEDRGRVPKALRPAHAYGITLKEAAMAVMNGGAATKPSPHHFEFPVAATKQWTHPGNYLAALGFLINGHELLIEAGAWESGFKLVTLNAAPIPIGSVSSLLALGTTSTSGLIKREHNTIRSRIISHRFSKVQASEQANSKGTSIDDSNGEGQEIDATLQEEQASSLNMNTLIRLSSHQIAITLSYISLVITNAHYFLNLDHIKLSDDVDHTLLHIEGLLGQTYHIHHMKSNGEKQDNDPHVHQDSFNESENKIESILEREYRDQHNDQKYHIDDYYVESRHIFGTDFVENRYSFTGTEGAEGGKG